MSENVIALLGNGRGWIAALVLLVLGAQLNLTALVPAERGQAAPPLWVGGRFIWPFSADTHTLLSGDALTTATPLLAIVATCCFLLAAAALLQWHVPAAWFAALVVAGALCSVALQLIWISPYAVLPLLLDVALLYAVFGAHMTVSVLRG